MKGYIQVYTGNGKGKSTAAFGLALRAIGAGKKVFIGQFIKGQRYSETEAIERYLPGITLKQYGLGCFILNQPTEEDTKAAMEGLDDIRTVVQSRKYSVVILDEINIALLYNLFNIHSLLPIIQNKPDELEIILTGRYADPELIKVADLVTEMKDIKHYYEKGIMARKGIEF
jgi:cob(I)alamin adenosyltransferase